MGLRGKSVWVELAREAHLGRGKVDSQGKESKLPELQTNGSSS